jgi:proteasome lid subunit RPN8/RPN11
MLWEEVAPAVTDLLNHIAEPLLTQRDLEYPNEAVGLVTDLFEVFPLINQARSPKRFEVSQRLVAEGIEQLAKHYQRPVAIYHSHPTSASGPSARDVLLMKENPGSLNLIVGMDGIAAWMWWEDELRSVTRIPLPERVKVLEVEG